jgi:CHAD domain-containing protein
MGAILIDSLGQRWHRFQLQLRRTQRRSTEASVHDLRVSMRRLMATVDMMRTLIPDEGLQKARRSLRKHLKDFNQLRDTHIQILALRALAREFPPLRPLGAELRRRESKLVRSARETIGSINPQQLERALADASIRLGTLLRLPGAQDVASATVIGAMGQAFVRAYELRQQINPADPASIHRLRVAFKKCRYMLEVLAPILPGANRRFLKSLDAYQTRMGEIQDMQVVTACVSGFTLNSRYAPTLSLVPVQQRLAEIRKQRVDEFLERSDELYGLWLAARTAPEESVPRHAEARGDAGGAAAPRGVRSDNGVSTGPAARRAGSPRPASKRKPAHRPAGKRKPAHRPAPPAGRTAGRVRT